MTKRNGATITWATYDLPTTLVAGGLQSQFWYGPDRNRWKQVASTVGGTATTIYVAGLIEKVTKPGIVLWKHYVPTPSGTAAVYIRRSDGTADTYYLTSDHLGSTWTGVPSATDLTSIGSTTPDGFTGHEHLDNLGLIHMNGRGSAVAGSARPAIPGSSPVTTTIDALPGLENRG